MPFRHGKNTKVLFGAFDLSAYLNQGQVSQSIETGETTAFGSSAKTYVVGLTDGTLSLQGMFDGDTLAVDTVMAAAVAQEDQVVTFAPEGLAAGRFIRGCYSMETSYQVSSPVGDVVSVSVDLQGDDRIDRGLSLIDLTAQSATGTGTAQDNTSSSTNGGVANLHVTNNSRNGTTVIKVQHSSDNVTYADLITFTTVGIAATTSERIAVTGTVNRYVRASHTLSGATGTITYHVNFARR